MKKTLCVLLTCFLLVASLSGCGTNKDEGNYTVTFEDGTESKYDIRQIEDLYKNDERKFRTIQKISGSGTISNADVEERYFSGTATSGKGYALVIKLKDGLTLKVTLNYTTTINGNVENYEPYSADIHGAYANSFFNGDTITFSTGEQYGKSFDGNTIHFFSDDGTFHYNVTKREISDLRMSDVTPANP